MAKKNIFLDAIKPQNLIAYIIGLRNDFGWKFTSYTMVNYFSIKGVLYEFIQMVQLPFYQFGNWPSQSYQKYMAVAFTPWTMSGFSALCTDLIPLFGYQKSSYIFIFTILGTISNIVPAVFKMNRDNVPDFVPVIFFCLINAQISWSDLLLGAKTIELMRKLPHNRGNAISFSYVLVTVGSLFPTLYIGPMTDKLHVSYAFIPIIPFTISPIACLLMGCIVNDKVEPHRNHCIDYEKMKGRKSVLLMCLILAFVGLGAAFVGFFGNEFHSFIYNLIGGIVLGILLLVMYPRVIAWILIYVYLAFMTYFNIDGHLEYFYTSECVEDGPHFSMTYYKTYVGVAGLLASFIGIWLFQAILSHYTYRLMFWVTIFIRVFASVFDIIILQRWNISVGIPDSYMYIIGSAIIYKVAFFMDYMPLALIIAKVCPKDIETSVYSVVAGYANYGMAVSRFFGGYLAQAFNVNIDAQNGICNWQNLTYIVIIGHMITPLLCVPLTFYCIPNKYVHENITDDHFDKFKLSKISKDTSTIKESQHLDQL